MKISFDPAKSDKNLRERGLSFDLAADFDFQTARFWVDDRHDYPEVRYIALGYLGHRLHVLVFQETNEGIRIISFRKANKREGQKHGFAQKRH